MGLPASEDTTTLRQGYVLREGAGNFHQAITNEGSAINQGDFVKDGPFFGLADEDIAATTGTGTIHVGAEYRVGAARIGTSQTFYTEDQAVYYDTSDGKFYEADASATRHLVGYVTEVASASIAYFAFRGIFPTVAYQPSS